MHNRKNHEFMIIDSDHININFYISSVGLAQFGSDKTITNCKQSLALQYGLVQLVIQAE